MIHISVICGQHFATQELVPLCFRSRGTNCCFIPKLMWLGMGAKGGQCQPAESECLRDHLGYRHLAYAEICGDGCLRLVHPKVAKEDLLLAWRQREDEGRDGLVHLI